MRKKPCRFRFALTTIITQSRVLVVFLRDSPTCPAPRPLLSVRKTTPRRMQPKLDRTRRVLSDHAKCVTRSISTSKLRYAHDMVREIRVNDALKYDS